jgi:hypothetical protein
LTRRLFTTPKTTGVLPAALVVSPQTTGHPTIPHPLHDSFDLHRAQGAVRSALRPEPDRVAVGVDAPSHGIDPSETERLGVRGGTMGTLRFHDDDNLVG